LRIQQKLAPFLSSARLAALAVVAWLLIAPMQPIVEAIAQEAEPPAATVPFHLPLPEGWRPETIPFPLSFAPAVKITGVEELRFAPGMFTEAAEDYWTYAFVWWVPESTELTIATIERDLILYFSGLTQSVVASKKLVVDELRFDVQLEEVPRGKDKSPLLIGTVKTFDPFTAIAPVTLNLWIEKILCPDQEHVAAYFALSPQPSGHPVWKTLQRIRDGFDCPL